MRNIIKKVIDLLSASYWFIPTLQALFAIILALIALQLDLRFGAALIDIIEPLIRATPAGLRAVLTTIAGSMITVAGTVFSLTMVVLTLAAQQYGPLVVSNFMRDRTNQFSLGAFVANFIYCLIVLPNIEDGNNLFVPALSSVIAIGLALLNAGILIYFIHHTSQSVQPAYIIGSISDTLMNSLDQLFPEGTGREPEFSIEGGEKLLPDDFVEQAYPVVSRYGGYLQLIDTEQVMALTVEHDLLLYLKLRPGDFLVEGSILAQLLPKERVNDEIVDQLQDAFSLGSERTLVQDSDLMVTQLVQIALRALSPGINDPYTALLCIDRLGEALAKIAQIDTPAARRFDDKGKLRIVTNPLTFKELLHTSFDGIRHYGAGDAQVLGYLLSTLELIAQTKCSSKDREAIYNYAQAIWNNAQNTITDPSGLISVESKLNDLRETLKFYV
ncbi:MAG: DUF2254 domain-containing protein [Ardenticatenaceae bacterium]|nr:DUF2254 domain-containing protein [Ardenticatenaceae bacterium]